MANIKSVEFKGSMPFDCMPFNHDNEADAIEKRDRLLRWLGWLSILTIGVTITWGEEYSSINKHGGTTRMFCFYVEGQEAMSWSALRDMIKCFKDVCCIRNEPILADMEA